MLLSFRLSLKTERREMNKIYLKALKQTYKPALGILYIILYMGLAIFILENVARYFNMLGTLFIMGTYLFISVTIICFIAELQSVKLNNEQKKRIKKLNK